RGLLHLLPLPRWACLPVGGGGRPARSQVAPALASRRGRGAPLGAQGPPPRAPRRLLRQASEGTPRARGPRPLPGVLRARPGSTAGARLPRGVRGRAPVARGQALGGRPDPPAPALHTRV